MLPVKIYGILNPLDEKMIYIGASLYPEDRFKIHKNGGDWNRITYRYKQIRLMKSANVEPKLVILEECHRSIADKREEYWMDHYKSLGHRLDQKRSGYPTSSTRSHRLSTINYNVKSDDMTNEEQINDFAIDALNVLSKVLHALQHSNMKGTILHQEISAAIKKGNACPLKAELPKKPFKVEYETKG